MQETQSLNVFVEQLLVFLCLDTKVNYIYIQGGCPPRQFLSGSLTSFLS